MKKTLKKIMGALTKEEDLNYPECWENFKRIDLCNECACLESSAPFDEVCPSCGSPSFDKVTARWKVQYCRLTLNRNYIEYEIRKDVK